MQIPTYMSAVDFLVLEIVRLSFFQDKIFCSEDEEKTQTLSSLDPNPHINQFCCG